MNLQDKILNKDFTSDDIIDFFVAGVGNAWIMDKPTMLLIRRMRDNYGNRLIKDNKLLSCPIVIVEEPCFRLGIMGV